MLRVKRIGVLIVGIMILLMFGSAACSAEPLGTSDKAGLEVAARDIKVYESPT